MNLASSYGSAYDNYGRYEPDESITLPGQFGAYPSKLYKLLKAGHYDVKLSPDDMHRLTLWLKTNTAFFGDYHDTAAQSRGEDPAQSRDAAEPRQAAEVLLLRFQLVVGSQGRGLGHPARLPPAPALREAIENHSRRLSRDAVRAERKPKLLSTPGGVCHEVVSVAALAAGLMATAQRGWRAKMENGCDFGKTLNGLIRSLEGAYLFGYTIRCRFWRGAASRPTGQGEFARAFERSLL